MGLSELLGKVQEKVRLFDWWIYAAAALVVVGIFAWDQLQVLAWKVALTSAGVVLAYAADRALFFRTIRINAEMPTDLFGAARLLARAIVVLAVMVGVTAGL